MGRAGIEQVRAHVMSAPEGGIQDALGAVGDGSFTGFGNLGPGAQVHYVSQLCCLLSNVTLDESLNLCAYSVAG